jgi:hypothetical protein
MVVQLILIIAELYTLNEQIFMVCGLNKVLKIHVFLIISSLIVLMGEERNVYSEKFPPINAYIYFPYPAST